MTKSEYKALLEEAFDTGYEDAKLDLFMESCGITEDYITETEENVEEWLNSYTEGAVPSPKELAVKIYERVLKSKKVAEAFAKNPDKVEIIKKNIKKLAVTAAKSCEKYRDNSKEIVSGTGLGIICSIIIGLLFGLGPFLSASAAIVASSSIILDNAIKIAFKDKDARKAIKFVKDNISKIAKKITPKKESVEEVKEEPSFDLEVDFGKFNAE